MKYNFDELIERANTNSVKYDLRERFFGTKDLMPMWVADMDFKTPSFIIEAIRKRTQHPVLGYTFFSEGYYAAIMNWLKSQHQWNIKKEWISFSPGVVPGLSFIIKTFTRVGDGVIIQPPVYHPFYSIVEDNNRTLLKNPLKLENDRFRIDFDNLKQQVKKGAKMILLSNPHNPGGTIWSKDELQQLGQLCVDNNVLIVSDEIHADLVLPGNKHIPIASLSAEISDNTITCMAPSKTFNLAGLATSFIVISNKDLLKKYNDELNRMHIWFGNIFGTEALEAAYNNGKEWLNQLMQYVKENLDYLTETINDKIPQIKIMRPDATYLVWMDCRGLKMTDDELKDFFIAKAKIGLNTGISFGKEGSGFMRMNIACPRQKLQKALEQIVNAIKLL